MSDTHTALETVLNYHAVSKHKPGQYAAGPDSLDWDMQPNPFREYEGCESISLPLTASQLTPTLKEILASDYRVDNEFTLETIGQFLEVSLGLSAWKAYGPDRWSLRCNPSSGNLHPTEAYLLCNSMTGIDQGVYHYKSYHHSLERRNSLSACSNLTENLPAECILIGLTSIHWRESWKYGVRAYRYCQLDTGHAIAALRYAAALQGWKLKILEHVSDEQISNLLGMSRKQDYQDSEKETPDTLLLLYRQNEPDISSIDIDALSRSAQASEWSGTANVLSPHGRIRWAEIDTVSHACSKPITPVKPLHTSVPGANSYTNKDYNASMLFRQRRSAQAFDGQTIMSTEDFYQIVSTLYPALQAMPFDCRNDDPHIHPVFYIHRVRDLPAGVYILPRSEQAMASLKNSLRTEFDWEKPETCPDDIPLYRLVRANCKNAAKKISCLQDIASDGAFAVSMLAEFEEVITEEPWKYRDLYYEAGMVGHALYISAECVGARGTGIGCFFDDSIHEILGIQNLELQCLYNFTVGTPVLDNRLVSLPPYSHLQNTQES